MIDELLLSTVSRRALAEITNIVSVEIVLRRDCNTTHAEREALHALYCTYRAFLKAWYDLETIDPVNYTHVWDSHLSDSDIMPTIVIKVQEALKNMLQDLEKDIAELLSEVMTDNYSASRQLLEKIVAVV